jgi:hypothetical protein
VVDRPGERTYFRHFPDKREVLFDGERRLTEWVTEAIASVPPGVPPWPAMRRTVALIVAPLEENRLAGDRLAAILAATPALRERAVLKEAHLVALITGLLTDRGASADEAALAARTAWGVLGYAVGAWRAAPGTRLQAYVDHGFAVLAGLISADCLPDSLGPVAGGQRPAPS